MVEIITAGDLANEMGKSYMAGLRKAIEDHRGYNIRNLWFIVKTEKNPSNIQKVHITYGILSEPLKFMRESMDMWKYDYLKDDLTLVWSLPHRTEMNNFLTHPEKYNKDLIYWIKRYLRQEKVNLKDKTKKFIPV